MPKYISKRSLVISVNNETEVANYTIEEKVWNGKDYLVVPVVMMVEGVHNGSRGAIFHSSQELSNSASNWNGMPVTISHPEVNGQYVSANSEQILQDWGVGHISNARMEDNKLKAEVWIDIQKTTAISPETITAINDGKVLEVSLGLFSEEDGIAGVWNNEEYISSAFNYMPDHLALLPGEVGACSVMDGCGIRVNKSNEKEGGKNVDVLEILSSLNEQNITEVNSNYYLYTSKDDETVLYRQNYEINDGKVELKEKEVINNESKEEKGMCKTCKEKAAALIANSHTHFDENDREWLEALSEDKLDKMIPTVKTVEKTVEVEVNKEVTKEMALEVLGLEKTQYEKGLEIYNAKRSEVVTNILNNTEKDVWSKEDLEAMKLETLERIEKSIGKKEGGFYVGGGNNNGDTDDFEVQPMMIPGVEFDKK